MDDPLHSTSNPSAADDPFDAGDTFDAALAAALRRRPDPVAGTDLAARVLARVAADAGEVRPAARPVAATTRRRWAAERVMTALATVAVLVVAAFGAARVLAAEAASGAIGSSVTAAATSAAQEVGPLVLVGSLGLAAAMVYAAVTASPAFEEPLLTPVRG